MKSRRRETPVASFQKCHGVFVILSWLFGFLRPIGLVILKKGESGTACESPLRAVTEFTISKSRGVATQQVGFAERWVEGGFCPATGREIRKPSNWAKGRSRRGVDEVELAWRKRWYFIECRGYYLDLRRYFTNEHRANVLRRYLYTPPANVRAKCFYIFYSSSSPSL